MITDYDDPQTPQTVQADVCIIGSGAAGITLAREFLGSGIRVAVLAGGSRRQEQADQELYASSVVGLPHKGTHEGRARVFGGTTTLWGGQALPLDAIDFEPRPWVAHSGWPFARTELMPFYKRAQQAMSLPDLDFDTDVWRTFGITPPAYDPALLLPTFSQWSPKPNFAEAYREALDKSPDVEVFLNAHAVNVQSDTSACTVEHVDVRTLSGRSGRVKAQCYVVCCGGIETARLLLASDSVQPGGLANGNDLVGRYFQDHVAVQAAWIHPHKRQRFQDLYDHFYRHGVKLLPKIALAPAAQREREVLNAVGIVGFGVPADSGLTSAKEVLRALRSRRAPTRRAVWNAAKDLDDVFKLAYRYRIQKRSFSPKRGPISLEAHCEQEPNPESRISLCAEVDALGMRRARVDWRVSDLSRKTADVFTETVAAEFERLHLGRVEPLPAPPDEEGWRKRIYDVYHHIGTARMHDDAGQGVVDADCRVHGLDNLYVAGSAVFPTGGYSNPTLTLLALCLRLADRLKASR